MITEGNMELDIVDDTDVYTEFLTKARQDILRGADIDKDWDELQSRHTYLGDIVTLSRKQAQTLSYLFSASEFFLSRLYDYCETYGECNFTDSAKVEKCRSILNVFMDLYEVTPVPTRNELNEEMEKRGFTLSREGGVLDRIQIADGVEADNSSIEKDDDGSYVDIQLKMVLKQFVTLGRKWCRELLSTKNQSEVEKIRRAIAVMDNFVAPKTLEW